MDMNRSAWDGMKGSSDGVLDRATDGAADGAADGVLDGAADGAADGVLDGAADGAADGVLDGVLINHSSGGFSSVSRPLSVIKYNDFSLSGFSAIPLFSNSNKS